MGSDGVTGLRQSVEWIISMDAEATKHDDSGEDSEMQFQGSWHSVS